MLANNIASQFLIEVMNTPYYIINRCMSRPLLEKTPYELLEGRKPNTFHLRNLE